MKIRWHLPFVMGVFLVALIGGTFAYSNVEGWSLLDSFYFVVVTVTTIGYGDFHPITTEGKIFTIFFAFFGVATAFYILSQISKSIFKKHFGEEVGEIKKGVKKEEELKKEIKSVVRKNLKR